MFESGSDASYDGIVVTTGSLGNARHLDKSITSVRGRMQAGSKNLRSSQKLALMKQQSEQPVENQQPHIQRLKDQLTQRQQQQQADKEHGQVLAYPLSLDQRAPKRGKPTSGARSAMLSAIASSLDHPQFGTTLPVHLSLQNSELMTRHGAALSAPTDFEGLNFEVRSPRSVALSSAATSVSEYEDLLNDIDCIAAMESEEITPSLPNIIFDASSYTDAHGGLTMSNSCPVIPMIPLQPAMRIQQQGAKVYKGGRRKEEPPPLLTEEDKVTYERDRFRKDTHNDIEKRRREKINDHIQELATLLPASYDLDLQNKKGTILQASVDYIKKLQRDREKVKKMEEEQRALERRNRQLQLQMQTLQINMQKQQESYKQQLQQQQQSEQQQLLLQLQQQLSQSQGSQNHLSQGQQPLHQQQHIVIHQQQPQQQQQQPVQIIVSETMLAELTEGNSMLQNDPLLYHTTSPATQHVDADVQLTSNLDLMDIGQEFIIGAEDGHIVELGIDANDCFNDFLNN